ncbi:HNH endonuclease [Nitrosomonas sp. Nm132]|nr:HNH endonuclease [Nitrosomonas sp. Nm132]
MQKIKSTDQVKKMSDLYQSGKLLKEIAEVMDCSVTTVWSHLNKFGIKMQSKGERSKGKPNFSRRKFDHSLAASLYSSGMSSTDVAEKLGISTTSAIKAILNSGLKMRGAGETTSLMARGNVSMSSHGYVRVSEDRKSRRYEHVLIAEKAIGRKLRKGEVVHHIDCDKTNNNPSNLMICTTGYHMQLHARMRRHPYWNKF